MKKTLKRSAVVALVALSLLASTSSAFAKDVKDGRGTAWTAGPAQPVWQLLEPVGVFSRSRPPRHHLGVTAS
jgi:hydrogenase/urease accessory protein HupE